MSFLTSINHWDAEFHIVSDTANWLDKRPSSSLYSFYHTIKIEVAYTELSPFIQLVKYHYLVIISLLQDFLSATNPITSTFPMGYRKCHSAGSPKFSLLHIIFSKFFLFFVLGSHPIREVNEFFSGDSNVFSINFNRCHWKVCTKMESRITLPF